MSNTNVVIFCGGRGSSAVLKEFIRHPSISLTLLVNAYDDGLSTGTLRDLVPSMLGPSDFRKNLSTILDLHSHSQYSLQQILEYRLPAGRPREMVEALVAQQNGRAVEKVVPQVLAEWFERLSAEQAQQIAERIGDFLDFQKQASPDFPFEDCSLGNLVFAGAFLKCNGNFNQALVYLSSLFPARANLVNVTRGENRTLLALKEDGTLLLKEAEVVGSQNDSRIVEFSLAEKTPSPEAARELHALSFEAKREWLRSQHSPVYLSDEARSAILNADIIVYGSGTQFSSLLPSYRCVGIREVITSSSARAKVMLANLEHDQDIQGLAVSDLVDNALAALGDPENQARAITHLLYHNASQPGRNYLSFHRADREVPATYKGIRVVPGDYANPASPKIHSGYQVVKTLLRCDERSSEPFRRPTLTVFVDLSERSVALSALLQEFKELPWKKRFQRVELVVNGAVPEGSYEFPDYLSLTSTKIGGEFPEIEFLSSWIENQTGDYLLTLTGDGEYRLREVFTGIKLTEETGFGIVHGSRTQSRRQFLFSLHSAYGEVGVLYRISSLAGYLISGIFGAYWHSFFSDPLTGFRLYSRERINPKFRQSILRRKPIAPVGVAVRALRSEVEVAEFPVSYRTFRGFTRVRWRVRRGLLNLLGFLL